MSLYRVEGVIYSFHSIINSILYNLRSLVGSFIERKSNWFSSIRSKVPFRTHRSKWKTSVTGRNRGSPEPKIWRDSGRAIVAIKLMTSTSTGFRWLFHPRWLAAWLPRHFARSVDRIPRRIADPPDPLNDWLRSFRSYRSNKNHALLLTINSTEIAMLPPPPLCPADNVLPSLTSLPILHDRYELANYSYHSCRQFISTVYNPWQSSSAVHRTLVFFILLWNLVPLPTLWSFL